MKKSFYLNDSDILNLSKVITSNSFEVYTIIRIYGKRIMFFHNDLPDSRDGMNYKLIRKFKELKERNLVDNFICCFPEITEISEYCWLGRNASGEIHIHQEDNGRIILSC